MQQDLSKLAFLDVETTGSSPLSNRVIDIGVVLVDDGKVVGTWESFVNPQQPIPQFISRMTGISNRDVAQAPLFVDIADELMSKLENRIFVAHNARFDYSFVRQEYLRTGNKIRLAQLCTVQLSRMLFPDERSHSLDAIMQRFELSCENRHRALPDAELASKFFLKTHEIFPKKKIEEHVRRIVRRPALPTQISYQDIEKLPSGPGVYIMYGGSPHSALFVGHGKSIREKAYSHFFSDMVSDRVKVMKDEVLYIESREMAGELEASLAEMKLIRELSPRFNRNIHDGRQICELKLKKDEDGYFEICLEERENVKMDEVQKLFGVWSNKRQAIQRLRKLSEDASSSTNTFGEQVAEDNEFDNEVPILFAKDGQSTGDYNLRLQKALYSIQVRKWPYSGAIGIKEYNWRAELSAIHLFDQWCYLKTIRTEEELNELDLSTGIEGVFDIYIYRILRQYFARPRSFVSIFQLL
jgi:DNA polymerase-3 subunit epsilon